MPAYAVGDPDVLAFLVLPIGLAALLVWAAVFARHRSGAPRREAARVGAVAAVLVSAWMLATWRSASSGVLQRWDATPPPFAVLVVTIVVIGAVVAFSRTGREIATHVPLWALVAVQGFRLPLELAMHHLVGRGIMPVQMSYSGWNFDILTGTTAIVVAAVAAAGRGGRTLILCWNIAGTLLLLNVVVIAVLSTPRFRAFGDDRLNVFVTYAPFVWLPAVMVLAAFAGHLLVFRALRRQRRVVTLISQQV